VCYVPVYARGIIHLALGEQSRALECFRAACDERYPQVVYLGVEPVFDILRADRRFQELMERLGLPAEPRTR
jgi:hypothetical protein